MIRDVMRMVRPSKKVLIVGEDDNSSFPVLPAESSRKEDLVLDMLLNGVWQQRRVVYTSEIIGFARTNEDLMVDMIFLAEVLFAIEMDEPGTKIRKKDSEVDRDTNSLNNLSNTLKIETSADGHNSGRTYYMRTSSNEACKRLCIEITRLAKAAKARKEGKSFFRTSQKRARQFCHSKPFQHLTAFMIAANFIASIVDSELRTADDTMGALNLFFTVAFTAELCLNAFAHWFREWVGNAWNLLDFAVVVVSVVSMAASGDPGSPLGLVRLLRAVRMLQMVRLFGRVRPLRTLVEGIAASVVPMVFAFLILFIVISVYSMVGVSLFQEDQPHNFSVFSQAFLTLFFVTTGTAQPIALLAPDGTQNWPHVIFLATYYMVVSWMLLQVCVCVLLDNFLSTCAASEEEATANYRAERRRLRHVTNPLEPLLMRLIRDYVDDADLSARLRCLFKMLDSDDTQALSCQAFCIAMKKLDCGAPIHLSASDFVSLTNNGCFCDAAGKVGAAEFEAVMRQQMRLYTQSRLSEIGADYRTEADVEFTQLGAIKMLLTEHLRTSADLAHVRRDLEQLLQHHNLRSLPPVPNWQSGPGMSGMCSIGGEGKQEPAHGNRYGRVDRDGYLCSCDGRGCGREGGDDHARAAGGDLACVARALADIADALRRAGLAVGAGDAAGIAAAAAAAAAAVTRQSTTEACCGTATLADPPAVEAIAAARHWNSATHTANAVPGDDAHISHSEQGTGTTAHPSVEEYTSIGLKPKNDIAPHFPAVPAAQDASSSTLPYDAVETTVIPLLRRIAPVATDVNSTVHSTISTGPTPAAPTTRRGSGFGSFVHSPQRGSRDQAANGTTFAGEGIGSFDFPRTLRAAPAMPATEAEAASEGGRLARLADRWEGSHKEALDLQSGWDDSPGGGVRNDSDHVSVNDVATLISSVVTGHTTDLYGSGNYYAEAGHQVSAPASDASTQPAAAAGEASPVWAPNKPVRVLPVKAAAGRGGDPPFREARKGNSVGVGGGERARSMLSDFDAVVG